MVRLIIEVPSATYPVVIGSNLNRELRGVIGRLDPTTAAIVTDRNVLPWAKKVARAAKRAGVRTPIHVVPPGERSKSMGALGDVLGFLERQKVDRSGVVIAVGGGTVGDLAGFAAATWQRGIRLVAVPKKIGRARGGE